MELITPLDQFLSRAQAHPQKTYMHAPKGDDWYTLSWQQVEDKAKRLANALYALGCEEGDRIAILGKNSAEWVISDIAIMMAGMISVPVYATAGTGTLDHILSHSESKVLLLGNLESYKAFEGISADCQVVYWSDQAPASGQAWHSLVDSTAPIETCNQAAPEDTLSITYTSGSSGLPKGVVLTYGNLGHQAQSFMRALTQGKDVEHRALSYLPLAHITERSTVEIASFYANIELYFNTGLSTFLSDLQYAKPTLFISVPRLWVKFQQGVLAKISDKKLQARLKIPFLGKIIAKKILTKLGLNHVTFAGCGSAPVSYDTLDWYRRLGLNITEAWGMTETCGVACANLPYKDRDLGTIGVPIDVFDMKLSEQGEILIKGEGIFTEYYQNPEATSESFEDGWFKTGDKGTVDEHGAWKITGRVKETFKTAKGKFVNPVPIERALAIETRIEQVCVLGQGRGQPLALVVLNEAITGFDQEVHDSLADTLKTVNAELEGHQRLDNIVVCKDAWGIEENLLTPTLKLKRDQIAEKYSAFVVQESKETVIWE